jgi:hypothetical protein
MVLRLIDVYFLALLMIKLGKSGSWKKFPNGRGGNDYSWCSAQPRHYRVVAVNWHDCCEFCVRHVHSLMSWFALRSERLADFVEGKRVTP